MYRPAQINETSAEATESERKYIENVLYEIFRKHFHWQERSTEKTDSKLPKGRR